MTDGVHVPWSTWSEWNDGKIVYAPCEGGPAQELASQQTFYPGDMAIDDHAVYWASSKAVHRLARP